MKYRDAFSGFHPINNFLYFGIVMGTTMFVLHPALLFVSFLGASLYHRKLKGRKAALFTLLYMLPLFLFASLLNPLFNHEGMTVLLWLPSGNPLTAEALLYGVLSAAAIVSVITWFACFHTVMSSDKFIYLFGRIIPALSLVISMALRFVPVYLNRIREIREGRAMSGASSEERKLKQKLASGLSVVSSLIGWALESSVETADSMKARGYGLPGRTAFTVYEFGFRDRVMAGWLLFSLGALSMGLAAGLFDWRCYPTVKGAETNAFTVFFLLLYLLTVLTPVLTDVYEEYTFQKGIRRAYD